MQILERRVFGVSSSSFTCSNFRGDIASSKLSTKQQSNEAIVSGINKESLHSLQTVFYILLRRLTGELTRGSEDKVDNLLVAMQYC